MGIAVMAVRITHVRFSTTTKTHETITDYKWTSLQDNSTGSSSKATMVDWMDNKNGRAVVGSGAAQVEVGVVHPAKGQPYLRTYADKVWNNNLLSLPTF